MMLRDLPLAYRCAIEWFAADGERTHERLDELLDFYETSSGLRQPELSALLPIWRAEAHKHAPR